MEEVDAWPEASHLMPCNDIGAQTRDVIGWVWCDVTLDGEGVNGAVEAGMDGS
jgi:hypothetical protein